jgi:hypothetical protein
MSDKTAVQDLIGTYSHAVSRLDWDEAISTFAADAIWDVPALATYAQGIGEISAALRALAGNVAFLLQSYSPAIIALDGDRASARSLMRENAGSFEGDEMLEVLGTYDDEVTRTPAGWKFARRRFTVISLHQSVIRRMPLATP